jgi:hypothetical protein
MQLTLHRPLLRAEKTNLYLKDKLGKINSFFEATSEKK